MGANRRRPPDVRNQYARVRTMRSAGVNRRGGPLRCVEQRSRGLAHQVRARPRCHEEPRSLSCADSDGEYARNSRQGARPEIRTTRAGAGWRAGTRTKGRRSLHDSPDSGVAFLRRAREARAGACGGKRRPLRRAGPPKNGRNARIRASASRAGRESRGTSAGAAREEPWSTRVFRSVGPAPHRPTEAGASIAREQAHQGRRRRIAPSVRKTIVSLDA